MSRRDWRTASCPWLQAPAVHVAVLWLSNGDLVKFDQELEGAYW